MIVQKEGNTWNKNFVWSMLICTDVLAGVVMNSFKPHTSAGRLINSIMDGRFGWRVHGAG